MRGRKPKPTALKLLQGNPGHRKIDSQTEPQPVIGLGAPPSYLDPEATRYWMAQGPQLVKLGTLGESDACLFALLCQSHSRNLWLSSRIHALRRKSVLSKRDDTRLAKYEAAAIKNAGQFQKLAAEFGIGAASRTRIRVRPQDGQGELPLDGIDSPLARAMAGARGE